MRVVLSSSVPHFLIRFSTFQIIDLFVQHSGSPKQSNLTETDRHPGAWGNPEGTKENPGAIGEPCNIQGDARKMEENDKKGDISHFWTS